MDVGRLTKLLEESRAECLRKQHEIDILLSDRTATEKKALELMQNLCESQKKHYESELNSLKGQLVEQTKYIESLERAKSSILARAKSLESEVIQRRKEIQDAAALIQEASEENVKKRNRKEVGNLRTSQMYLEKKIETMQNEIDSLTKDIAAEKEKNVKFENDVRENVKLAEQYEISLDITTRSLLEEISKVKEQKADLRIRFRELERENFRLREGKTTQADQSAKDEIKRLRNDLVVTSEKLTVSTETLEHLCQERDSLKHENQRLVTEKEELRERLAKVKEEMVSKDALLANDSVKTELETKVSKLSEDNRILKDALTDLDGQCEELMSLQKKYKQKCEELLVEIQRSASGLERHVTEFENCKTDLAREKKERERAELKVTMLAEELAATHNDYREELLSLSRMVANEKGISIEYVDQMESLKNAKHDLESQLKLIESLFQDSVKEKRFLEDERDNLKRNIDELKVKHHEKFFTAKKALDEAIDKCERYKRESEVWKVERDSLDSLYKTTKQALELEIVKLNATVLQHQKLITHLQTQMTLPKRKCFLCPDKKFASPQALAADKFETILADHRKNIATLSKTIRELQVALNEERAKNVMRTHNREVVGGREIAIIKKTASLSSDISTGSSVDGVMRHNIPHIWKKELVTKKMKCMACMVDLPLSGHYAKCKACKTVVHHTCAETLMNTCGLPMLYNEFFNDEEKRMKENVADARMYGWVKLWRSHVDGWHDVWVSLENGVLSFYKSSDTKQMPIETIDLQSCNWKIHRRNNIEDSDACELNQVDLPFIIEIKINPTQSQAGTHMYMMTPDLPSKQRWLCALQKAFPQ